MIPERVSMSRETGIFVAFIVLLLGFVALVIVQISTCVYLSLPGGLYHAVCAHVSAI